MPIFIATIGTGGMMAAAHAATTTSISQGSTPIWAILLAAVLSGTVGMLAQRFWDKWESKKLEAKNESSAKLEITRQVTEATWQQALDIINELKQELRRLSIEVDNLKKENISLRDTIFALRTNINTEWIKTLDVSCKNDSSKNCPDGCGDACQEPLLPIL